MRLLRRLRYLLQRDRRDEELAEEIAFHRTLAEEDHRAAGLPPEPARHAASRQLGNVTRAREAAHHVWSPAWIEGLAQDIHYAWRGLSRNRALLVVACLSLGLSTGFGTALFSVVNAVVLQPISVSSAASLASFWVGTGNRVSWLNLHDLCEDTPGLTCTGYRMEEVSWQHGDEPVRLFGQAVTPNYFTALGINVSRGRTFEAVHKDMQGDMNVVVITHAFWQRHLAGDPDVLDRKLVLNGRPYTVIGVLPQGFRSIWGLGIAPSLYLPAGSALRPPTDKRADTQYEMLGVLNPGQSLNQFRTMVLQRAQDLERLYPLDNKGLGRVRTFSVQRFGLFMNSDQGMISALLLFGSLPMVLVLMLTVVACVNVAGLLVARAIARQQEIAVRLSIGCSRMRLARLLLAESFLLAAIGVGLGAIASVWLAQILIALPTPFPVPFELEVPLDWHLLLYLALIVGLATTVSGLAPILQAWRVPLAIRTGSTSRGVSGRRWSLRASLIAGQVAVSTVLLVATMLFVRSLWAASQIDPGFDLDRVVTIESELGSWLNNAQSIAAYRNSEIERLRHVPGVSAVSGARIVPLSMNSTVNSVSVDLGDKELGIEVDSNYVLPDYFRVMGISVKAGRDFTEADREPRPLAVLVNETFARRVFPNTSAAGHRLRRPSAPEKPEPWAEIIGVVADSRYLTLGEDPRPQVYWPFERNTAANMIILARTEGDSAALVRDLPAIVRSLDPRIPVRVLPLRSVMAVALFPAQVAAVLLAALGIVGWILTVTGLYGVVAYTVTRRVPEIGIRMALGATPASVLKLLLKDGMTIAAVGLSTGLVLAAIATPLLGMFLAGVDPHDPASFVIVVAVLVVTALAASYGPARRGTGLTPAAALRNE